MRNVKYSVVSSLDGYIGGPNGEADWIPADPDVDFNALFAQFDTIIVGRATFEIMAKAGRTTIPGMQTVVFSSTLDPAFHPSVRIEADAVATTKELREGTGKDIWLFGGGSLFRTLLEHHLVDAVSVTIAPVLLGGGIPLLPPGAARSRLSLKNHRVYPKTGLINLEYDVARA